MNSGVAVLTGTRLYSLVASGAKRIKRRDDTLHLLISFQLGVIEQLPS